MTLVRRSKIPAAAPPPAPPAKPAFAPRKRIPIKAVGETKAYVPPVGLAAVGVNDTDYEGVMARYAARVKNPMTAIRARCVQCCNGSVHEVKRCPVTTCMLHPFRNGENPFNKKVRARLGLGDDDETE
jgi:hypothetical protein